MAKIGLFFGSSTSNTEYEAYLIKEAIEEELGADTVDVHNIASTEAGEIAEYDRLIFGIPTWDIGQLQEDWIDFWPDLGDIDFSGKTIAIFGPGDPYGYPDTFLDAVGMLGEKVIAQGGELIGYWSIDGFEFEDSLALSIDGEQFMGLALDEDNEPERTEERIDSWVEQILQEFGLTEQEREAVPA